VGNLSSTELANGVTVTPSVDLMNRVKELAATGKPGAAYSYQYGLVGNRTYAAGSAGGPLVSASYTYDSIYRLTQESLASAGVQAENGALTYGLDPVGNRQTLTSTLSAIATQPPMSYNANDRLLTNSYDANGNTLGAGGKTFAYDSQDRLTSFNGGAVTMVYDGDGNRVSKTAGGVTTLYLVDEANPTGLAQVVEELSSGGAVQRRYLYGPERIGQTQVSRGVTSYYGYDGHGDVRYLTDVTGKVTDTYDYDAFGNVIGSTGATANVYRYQGEALDAETGLYYLRARYYDPVAGRFLSVDPLADQGEHPYTYAGADPVNGHDPTGTQDLIEYTLLLNLSVPPRPTVHLNWDGFFDCIKAGKGPCTLLPGPNRPSKNKKKCRDFVNFPENDADKKNVVKRMLNENSAGSLGKPSYGIWPTIWGAGPTVTWDSVELEDRYFLTVLSNRLNNPSFSYLGRTLGGQAFNAGGGGFAGNEFPQGQGIYDRALSGPAGSFDCRDVFTAVTACNDGPITSQFRSAPLLFWKGVVQNRTNGGGTIVIPYRLGDVRVNNTEFSPRN